MQHIASNKLFLFETQYQIFQFQQRTLQWQLKIFETQRWIATIKSYVKGNHVTYYKYTISQELKRKLKVQNKYSSHAIMVLAKERNKELNRKTSKKLGSRRFGRNTIFTHENREKLKTLIIRTRKPRISNTEMWLEVSKCFNFLTVSYIMLKNGQTFCKILRCEHWKNYKKCFAIFQFAWKS